MARETDRKEDRRQEARQDKHHHDKDHKPKKKPGKKPGTPPPTTPGTVTEAIKAQSTQSGQDALNATPSGYPIDPANADAVFTTGLGQAVEYNYVRVDGGGGDVSPLQSQYTAPVAGHGQILTPAAAGETPQGMENNPT